MTKLPKISIVLPVYNEEKTIQKVLASIFSQEYPKDLIEVFVVDDNSTDATVSLAKKFPVEILKNGTHDPEKGKLIALKKSTGKYFTYVEGDLLLRNRNWLKFMTSPLEEDAGLAASFTSYYSQKNDALINKYLTLDPIQRDPLHRFFTPSVDKCLVEERKNYFVCQYEIRKIVPQGICLYRKRLLDLIYEKKEPYKDRFLELDNLVYLVEAGHILFAYVPQAGYYHAHVSSLADFLKKRRRNLISVFLPDEKKRRFRWIELNTFGGKIKTLLWFIYSESFVLPLATGLVRAIRYKSILALYEPVVAFLETNVLIFSMLKDERGRRFLLKSFIFSRHTPRQNLPSQRY